MKRVAVFGNAGGGKSTIARRLAELTGLPLYVVDMMQFRAGGVKVPQDEFLQAHADLLRRDEWIIDGAGGVALLWERFAADDVGNREQCAGTVRGRRYVGLRRSAPFDSLHLGDQAPHQRVVRRPERLAGRQSIVEQHT